MKPNVRRIKFPAISAAVKSTDSREEPISDIQVWRGTEGHLAGAASHSALSGQSACRQAFFKAAFYGCRSNFDFAASLTLSDSKKRSCPSR